MRVIVCGGRDYTDEPLVRDTLDAIHRDSPITILVQGGAKGVDRFAMTWALDRRVFRETFVAEWRRYGKTAGPERNKRMIAAGADMVLAFPGGRGTADCVRRARRAGIPVKEVR